MWHRVPLITIHHYLQPIENAWSATSTVLRSIHANPGLDAFTLKGHFVLMVSSFETMLSDLMSIHLRENPDKLKDVEVKLGWEDLLQISSTQSIIEQRVDQYVMSKAYDPVVKFLPKVCDVLEVPRFNDRDTMESLIELKETRNLLIHNNLRENSTYKDKAGPKARRPQYGVLPLNAAYVAEAGSCLAKLIAHFEHHIRVRYSALTRIEVVKGLWNMIFDTPVMEFEDFYHVFPERDGIGGPKRKRNLPDRISSTEWRFYQIWLAHTRGDVKIENFDMRYFGSETTQKLLWFLETLRHFNLN